LRAVCLASGPSLTQEDVDLVRQWREQTPDSLVVVANTTFRIAPWADALFAMDARWWKTYGAEVNEAFKGECFTTANDPSIAAMRPKSFNSYRNSGAGCISLASDRGAEQIVMLGYDCMKDGGLTHWHGSHPEGMSDAKTIAVWPVIFKRLAKDMKQKGVSVVNASRKTALTCFERVELEAVLHP